LQYGDAIDERGTHRAHQSAVLQAIAGSNHPSPWRERVLAEPAFEQQRIERLLDVRRAGRQLIEEQAERLGPFWQENARRAKHRPFADNARYAAHVLGRDLGAEQRAARQAGLTRCLVDHLGLPHPGRREQQEALFVRHALDELLGLTQRNGFVKRSSRRFQSAVLRDRSTPQRILHR
jgi:hypothetical protein